MRYGLVSEARRFVIPGAYAASAGRRRHRFLLLFFRHPEDVVPPELPDEVRVDGVDMRLDLGDELVVALGADDGAALAVDDLAHLALLSSNAALAHEGATDPLS